MKTPANNKMRRVTAYVSPDEYRSLEIIIKALQKTDRRGSRFGLVSRAVGTALIHLSICPTLNLKGKAS